MMNSAEIIYKTMHLYRASIVLDIPRYTFGVPYTSRYPHIHCDRYASGVLNIPTVLMMYFQYTYDIAPVIQLQDISPKF